jgi:filamentous hemagglutinin
MGVQIAGKHVALDAGRDILLSASQNTTHSESKNSGSQFSVGVGVSLIGAQNGISVELGASQHKGKENSQSQRNTNSVVHADEQLTVNSGRDTTLKGAELEGNRVVVNTSRDLTISRCRIQPAMTVSSLRPACPSVCAYRHCVMVPLPVASVRRVRISP